MTSALAGVGERRRERTVTEFDEYAKRYDCAMLERDAGILRVQLHTDNGPFQWGLGPQGELVRLFTDIAADRGNRVMILTGTGDEFSGPYQSSTRTVYNEGGAAITAESL